MAELDDEDFSNESLFQSALSDESPAAETEQVEAKETEATDQPRDEHGRFAEKQVEPEKPEAQAKPESKDDAQIPSWRLREIREERDELRRQLAAAQSQPRQPVEQQPKKPDIFENPDGFVKAGIQEQVDPIRAEISGIREFYSQRDAIKTHGQEKVTQAFQALDHAAKSGDPIAVATVAAVKQSIDPYGDIVAWHNRNVVGSDPEGYFNRTLEEKLKDEKFVASLAEKLKPAQSQEKPVSVVRMPPSLNRATSAAPVMDEGGDFSNESLFAHAIGR